MKEEADVRQALEKHNKFKEMKKQEIKPIERKDDVTENESNEGVSIFIVYFFQWVSTGSVLLEYSMYTSPAQVQYIPSPEKKKKKKGFH